MVSFGPCCTECAGIAVWLVQDSNWAAHAAEAPARVLHDFALKRLRWVLCLEIACRSFRLVSLPGSCHTNEESRLLLP